MRSLSVRPFLVCVVALLGAAPLASAQSLGTFKWQLQPYCNVVTVNVTGVAGVYTVEGFDDQCGAATRAPLTGVGTPNPDGSIGFGLHIVASPGGRAVSVDARISIANLSGPWSDSDGHTGTFAFNANTGGSRRPTPPPTVIPSTIGFRADGGFVAGGTEGVGQIPATGGGVRMMWHPAKAAFRAGLTSANQWDDASVGGYSAAFGVNTIASGNGSAAFGFNNEARGVGSFAAGMLNIAQGAQATAFGLRNEATGNFGFASGYLSRARGVGSVAMGYGAIANGLGRIALGGTEAAGVAAQGYGAIAIGQNVDAQGNNSLVLGMNAVTTVAARNSFVYSDGSSINAVQSFTPDEFKVRAGGGTIFYSNGAMTAGVRLAPSASAWSSLSDVHSKEHFRDLDGETVLSKLAAMPVREWNYKAQDAAIRHVGPTAQDFHAAFGLGEDPLRISTIDADGIALAGVRALEQRTQAAADREADALRALAELRARVASLESAVADMRAALAAMAHQR